MSAEIECSNYVEPTAESMRADLDARCLASVLAQYPGYSVTENMDWGLVEKTVAPMGPSRPMLKRTWKLEKADG